MQYIGTTHVKTIQAVNLMMKFKEREARFAEQLTANYARKPEDLETALAYGFYKYLGITTLVQGDDLVNTDLLQVIEVCNRILTNVTEDWFTHMLKLLIYSKLPEKMACDDEKLATLDRLLEVQAGVTVKEPYFILPYILYAEHWYTHNDHLRCLQYLTEGKGTIPAKAISYPDLNPHLVFPVKDFYTRLHYSNHTEIARKVKELGKIYFPQETIFS